MNAPAAPESPAPTSPGAAASETPTPAPPAAIAAGAPALQRRAFVIAWIVFWLLLVTVAVQEHGRRGGSGLWQPLLWEGSSCAVASAIVWAQWGRVRRIDHLLHSPWRWLARALQWLPLAAPAFVAAVYALRHAVYALLGHSYRHEPWPQVFGIEMLKFAAFYLLFVALIYAIRSHAALLHTRLQLEQQRGLAREAQLLQLTQQIEPHFLFNALNTIASAMATDPALAETLLLRLAALLRAATDLAQRSQTALDDELRLLDAYAAIMCQRFAERVSFSLDIDPAARACTVPTLCLQPLLENAFRHGVERRSQRTTIRVSAQLHAGRLRLQVIDDAGVLPTPVVFGVGLSNLRQRLQAHHADQASITLEQRDVGDSSGGDNIGVIASIELPCAC